MFSSCLPTFSLSFRHLHQEKQTASTLPLLRFPPFQSLHNTAVLPVPFTAMSLISFSISTASLRGVTWRLSVAAVLSPVLQTLRQWKTSLPPSSFLLKVKAISSVSCSCHLLEAIFIFHWPFLYLKTVLLLYLSCSLVQFFHSSTWLLSHILHLLPFIR